MPAQDRPGRVSSLRLSICVAVALVALAPAAFAVDVPPEMREKLEACAACHGPNGVSPNQEVPSLAAQPDVFTQWQLVYMRDGTRKVEAMQEVVKTMTDADIRFYGGYYAALPPPVPEHANPSEAESAEVLNLMRPRRCANCHDDTMAGKGEMPRLAGQREDYLAKALRDFRTNVRRGRGNAVMVELVSTITDNDIKLLAEYLSRLP
jgi:cytochrome c553